MKFEHNLVNILYIFLTVIKIISAGTKCYGAEFSEDISPCPDFENDIFRCDTLKLDMVEGKEAELGLNGNIIVKEDIVEGTEVHVDIWKMMEVGKEFLYHMQADLCQNLKAEDAPWYPMVVSMNILECPINPHDYGIKDMSISLNHSQEMMTHEMIGDYIVGIKLITKMDTISCYELRVTVIDYSC